jgi:hypothetical protein
MPKNSKLTIIQMKIKLFLLKKHYTSRDSMKKNALLFILLASTGMNILPNDDESKEVVTYMLSGVEAENFQTGMEAVLGVGFAAFGGYVLNRCLFNPKEDDKGKKIEPMTVLVGTGCAALGIALCAKTIHKLVA